MLQIEYDYLMEVTEIISTNARNARKKAGLTQEMVAKRCGITAHHYADIEAGRKKPSVDLLFNLGLALGVSGADLLESGAEVKPLTIEPRKVLEKYLAIPSEIVELASEFGEDSSVWNSVKVVMEDALKDEIKKKARNG